LFNLRDDPFEQDDLVQSKPVELKRLMGGLVAALEGRLDARPGEAVAVVELATVASALRAADVALKTLGSDVKVLSPDLDNGILNFRSPRKLDVGAVQRAVTGSMGVKEVREVGEVAGQFEYQVVASGMAEKITQAMTVNGGQDFEVRRTEYVGPQVGKQLRNKGVGSLLYAILAILVYVAFRFDLRFAPGGILALVHDSLVTLGFFVVTRKEVTISTVAAILTVVGYSMNDTIIVYDRIRENLAKKRNSRMLDVINLSVSEMLSRTILTSLTVVLSVSAFAVIGTGVIRDFAWAMIIGVLAGTYSSIYVAAPFTEWIDSRFFHDASAPAAPSASTAADA
jgi:preprotein translocase subunit SecF